MPEEAAAINPEQQSAPSVFQQIYSLGIRLLIVYWVVNAFKSQFSPVPSPSQSPSSAGVAAPSTSAYSHCIWPDGTWVQVSICVSESSIKCDQAKQSLLSHRMRIGDWASHFERSLNLSASDNLRFHNGSLYAHIYVARDGVGPSQISSRPLDIFYRVHSLVSYLPRQKSAAKKSLLSSSTPSNSTEVSTVDEVEDDAIVGHWNRNLTLNLIPSAGALPVAQLSSMPHIMKHLQFTSSERTRHYPILFINDFWHLEEDTRHFPINSTVTSLPLSLSISPLSFWKFQMMLQMDQSFHSQQSMMGVKSSEVDQIKRMLFETNPWLLGITFAVSLLHSLFDFLAFKNDVQFWRERENLEGLSLRSIALNISFQLIVLLYLADNDTSWMILISSAIGLLIEIWKVQKAVKVRVERKSWFFGLIPYTIVIEDRSPKSKLGKETDDYDKLAFKYLGIAAFPCVIGYSIYSLIYEQHKSWYSWVINTAVGFVYTFGFVAMTPQLFINYKMKSVAHMPWKTFMYKALNTFIDDLFAFVIKMPTLHRLACFRDDIVFLVYLYQKWIYPVDKTRRNEFGQVGEAPAATTQEDDSII
eukprot:Partr_v1_DN27494_c1_g4_i1_m72462 putative cleft lip and palate